MSTATGSGLVAIRRAFDSIPEDVWDGLAERTPWATPFSRYCVQRAWWDAYGATAHDQTLVVVDRGRAGRGRRHRAAHASPRGRAGRRGGADHDPASARLGADARARRRRPSSSAPPTTPTTRRSWPRPRTSIRVARLWSSRSPQADPLALGRRRPAPAALRRPGRRRARQALRSGMAPKAGWHVTREREDVCPIVTLHAGPGLRGYLGTLGKKERHEIRRKVRRAEAAGAGRLERRPTPLGDLDEFIDLHQKRWGDDGLFPATQGGAASRRFFAGLFEDCAPTGIVGSRFLTVGGRRIAAGQVRRRRRRLLLQRRRRPGRARALAGRRDGRLLPPDGPSSRAGPALDFLRGDEPYKYEWGAVDEPIQRLLVQRTRRVDGAARYDIGARATAWASPAPTCCSSRTPLAGGRVRVVEVLATGTNGGAQEHVYLAPHPPRPDRYDARVVSLSHGSSVRRLRAGRDRRQRHRRARRRARRPALADAARRLRARRRPQPHVPGRGGRHARRAALGEAGCRRPFVVSTVHSSRVRSAEDREALRLLTPRWTA